MTKFKNTMPLIKENTPEESASAKHLLEHIVSCKKDDMFCDNCMKWVKGDTCEKCGNTELLYDKTY